MQWLLVVAAIASLVLVGRLIWARKHRALPAVAKPGAVPSGPAPPAVPALYDSARPPGEEAELDLTKVRPFLHRLADEEHEGTESKALVHFAEPALSRDEPSGPHDLIWVQAEGISDRGITRPRNEDFHLVDSALGLFVVADGMGGYSRGEVASKSAVQRVQAFIRAAEPVIGHEDLPQHARTLVGAVESANETVQAISRVSVEPKKQMGTTLLATRVFSRSRRIYVAHVGDSRCYRLRAGTLKQLTTDHTHEARGATGSSAHHLFRGVGLAKEIHVDLVVDQALHGDIYLLCTDGLTRMIGDQEIQQILEKSPDNMRRAARSLVLAANAKGGRDNITVVVLGIEDAATEHTSKGAPALS
jgi:protein phosphatase